MLGGNSGHKPRNLLWPKDLEQKHKPSSLLPSPHRQTQLCPESYPQLQAAGSSAEASRGEVMRRCRASRAKSWARTQPAATNLMGKTRTHLRNKAPTPILVSSTLYSLRPFLLPQSQDLPALPDPKGSRSFQGNVAPGIQEFPWWLSGKECARQCRRHGFGLWVGNIPRRRKWQPSPGFLPGKPHRQRSLGGYSPWGCKKHDLVTKQQKQQSKS